MYSALTGFIVDIDNFNILVIYWYSVILKSHH